MAKKAVIFDMDGVLFDSESLCRDCWTKLANEHGLQDMEQVFTRCIGTNYHDTKEILLGHYGQDFPYEDFRKQSSVLFWQWIEENGMPVKKGVVELLQYLKKEGYLVSLASSSGRESVEKCLGRANIRNYFCQLTTGDMVVHSKPNPEIYEIACRSLGVAPKDAYAIEDSYNGIRSAHRAGMIPIMVPDLIKPNQEMEELASVILPDLLKVIDYLAESKRKIAE